MKTFTRTFETEMMIASDIYKFNLDKTSVI